MAGWGNYGGGGTTQMQQYYSDWQEGQEAPLGEGEGQGQGLGVPQTPPYEENDGYTEKKTPQTQPEWQLKVQVESVAPPPQNMNPEPVRMLKSQTDKRFNELQQKEYILQIREQKLDTWEESIKLREAAAVKNKVTILGNIKKEIPIVNQRMVYIAYYIWIFSCIGYITNWFIILVALIAGLKKSWEWFVSTLVAVIGVPGSFLAWYKWGIYKAARTSGNIVFYGYFFFNFIIHFIWNCIMFFSIPIRAMFSVGIFSMIKFFEVGGGMGNFLGFASLVVIVVIGVQLIMSVFLFGMAARAFREVDLENQKNNNNNNNSQHMVDKGEMMQSLDQQVDANDLNDLDASD